MSFLALDKIFCLGIKYFAKDNIDVVLDKNILSDGQMDRALI